MSTGNVTDHPATRVLQEEVAECSADMAEGVSARQGAKAAGVPKAGVASFDTCLHAPLQAVEAFTLYSRVDVWELRVEDEAFRRLKRPW